MSEFAAENASGSPWSVPDTEWTGEAPSMDIVPSSLARKYEVEYEEEVPIVASEGRGRAEQAALAQKTTRTGESVGVIDPAQDPVVQMQDALTAIPRDQLPVRGKFLFLGPHADKEFQEWFTAAIENSRDTISFDGESPLTDAEHEYIEQLHQAIVTVGDELGVDLRDRLPKLSHYHMFDQSEKEAFRRAARDESKTSNAVASTNEKDGIIVLRPPQEQKLKVVLAHETAHDVSMYPVLPQINPENNQVERICVVPGYPHAEFYTSGLVEVTTDILAARAMLTLGEQNFRPQYRHAWIMMTGIIKETAATHNPLMDLPDISDQLVNDMLTARTDGVELTRRHLGNAGLHWLTKEFIGTESPDHLYKKAQEFKLPTAVKAFGAILDMQKTKESA